MKYDADWTAAQVPQPRSDASDRPRAQGAPGPGRGTAGIPEVGADGGVYDSATITCTLAGGGS